MKKNFKVLSVVLVLFFAVSCAKAPLEPNDTNSEMRTRPPCYEIAIDTAIKNYSKLEDVLKELLPLSEDAKLKGCFEEFKIIIIEMFKENGETLTEEQIEMVHKYYM